ncbi:cg5915-pa [Stylonychia lemnae]|uniref:Cg5915-pa n=1 Tax=Stylonychia lemnae TaxID=5949 RepID=A0A078ARC5_STYLE|nr:cg5915-pa [Stylonychia lemnae]|eukprot:CDW83777.1 cg5915-pa [Stylonychia lemnae]
MEGDDLKTVTLQIWDTAGQERYQSLGVAFYRGAEACVLVYDITNQRSFENLNIWKQDFLVKANPKNPDHFPFFVFGNKLDKAEERKVPIQRVEEWLQKNNDIPYEETSAIEGANVEKITEGSGAKKFGLTENKKTYKGKQGRCC